MPPSLIHSRPYLTWVLMNAIGHELFHHELISGNRRRPRFSSEQAAADRQGEDVAALIVRRLFNPLTLDLTWDRARQFVAESETTNPLAAGKHQ